MFTLKQLAAVDHPYYCHNNNYYSNEAAMQFETATDFLDCFAEADIDMNLCFRWDVFEREGTQGNATGTYRAEVFIMLQRKGIFKPCSIKSIGEHEVGRFVEYLHKHHEVLLRMWNPLSGN